MSDVLVVVNAEAKKAIDEAIKRGLKKVGMQAETYAKQLSPVDTGLLRNSITFALGGETTNITEYTDDKGENRGTYEGEAPADAEGETTVYVGTNVHYAPYQELGHATVNGGFVDAQAFLRPAMENHTDQYKLIIADELSRIK